MANNTIGSAVTQAFAGLSAMQQGAINREETAYQKSLRARNEAIVAEERARAIAQEERAALAATEATTRAGEATVAANNADIAAKSAEVQAQQTIELGKYTKTQRPVAEKAAKLANEKQQVDIASIELGNQKKTDELTTSHNRNYTMPALLTDPDGVNVTSPTRLQNVMRFASKDENKAVVVDMMNQNKAFHYFVDPITGKRIEIDVTGYTITDQAVIPTIVRADNGKELTPTVNGSTEDSDQVLMQNYADFTTMMNNHVTSVYNNGGSESEAFQAKNIETGSRLAETYNVGQENLIAARRQAQEDADALDAETEADSEKQRVRDAAKRLGAAYTSMNPKAAREFIGLLDRADTMEKLLEIYQGVGGDPAALEKQISDEKDAKRSQFSRAIDPLGAKGTGWVGPAKQSAMTMLGVDTKAEYDKYQELIASDDLKALKSAGGKSGWMGTKQTDADYKTNTAAELWYDERIVGLAKAMTKNPNIDEQYKKLGPVEFYKKFGVDTEGNPVDTDKLLSSIQPPPFELTRDNIIKSLTELTMSPTEEQQADMSTFLKSKGITSDATMKTAIENMEIEQNDIRAALYVVASQVKGDTPTKLAATQSWLNLAERGDINVGKVAQRTMDNADRTRSDNIATARVAANTALADEELKRARPAAEELMASSTQIMGDGPPTPEKSQQLGRSLTTIFRKLTTAKTPEAKEEYLSAINPQLSLILQGLAQDEKWFFESDVDGQAGDFNLQYVQWDGEKLAYAPPGGQQGGSVSQFKLSKMSENVRGILRFAADFNGDKGGGK